MKFKCPVCKSTLDITGSASQIRCGTCDTSFNKQKILELKKKRESQKIGDKSQGNSQSKPKIQPKTGSTPSPGQPSIQVKTSPSGPVPASEVLAKSHAKRKRRNRTQLLFLIGFSLLTVVLLIAIVIVMMNSEDPDNGDDETIDQQQTEQPSELGELPEAESVSQLPAGPQTDDAIPKVPFGQLDDPVATIEEPARQFKPKRLLETSWFNIRPYIVELYAETPTGQQTATGIVVDSRGWVVTSFSAFSQAREIFVRKSQIAAQEDQDRDIDKVLGFIGSEPKHDLLLLAINRRLVDSFAEISLTSDQAAVASQYLIQCQSPTNRFPYPAFESRIQAAAVLEQLPDEIAQQLQSKSYDPAVRWLVHENRSPLKSGAPLIDDDGKLVAMNTGASIDDKKISVAVPVIHLSRLKDKAADQIQALPVLVDTTAENRFASTQANIPIVQPAAGPSNDDLDLDALGQQCDSFGWWPNSVDEEAILRQFVRRLVEAKKQVESQGQPSDQSQLLLAEIKQWETRLKEMLGVGSERSRDQIEKFNQTFAYQPAPDTPFIAYVFVSHAAINLQKIAISTAAPTDVVGLEIRGLGDRLAVNVDPQWPPMFTDSPWLIIGSTIPRRGLRLTEADNSETRFAMGKVDFVYQSD